MANKIKKGDMVRVITGKDKLKEGKVLAVKEGAVLVEGINLVQKHTKPNAANQNGGIISKESYIDVSNVMFLADGEAVRVGFEVKDGKKYRVNKKTGAVIDEIKKPEKKN